MPEDKAIEVVTYLDHVMLTIDEITNERAVPMLAMRVQERTQMNIRSNDQIDTGFMVNAIYSIFPDKSNYSEVRRDALANSTDKAGKRVDHSESMASEVHMRRDYSAGVIVAAIYAIYQENQNPFMAPAAEAAAAEMDTEISKVYKKFTKDGSGNWRAKGKVVL